MIPHNIARIVNSLQSLGPAAAQELAAALCQSEAQGNYYGPVTIQGCLPLEAREYGPNAADDKHCPSPPVAELGSRAMVTISNQPIGDSDKRGDNGLALNIKGVARFEEAWAIKFAQVRATGVVTDQRQWEFSTSGLTSQYYFSDCWEAADSKGRGDQTVPVRVFQISPAAPDSGEVISYIRDMRGLAWRVDGAASVRAGVAVAPWNWVAGLEGKLGSVVCERISSIHTMAPISGANQLTVYIRSTEARDPNAHPGDLVQWSYLGTELVAIDSLDAKIGTVQVWNGPYSSIPKGWRLYGELGGRFPVGATSSPTSEYYHARAHVVGGNHPIVPHKHSDQEYGEIYYTDPWTKQEWHDSHWYLSNHWIGMEEAGEHSHSVSLQVGYATQGYSAQGPLTQLVSSVEVTENPAGLHFHEIAILAGFIPESPGKMRHEGSLHHRKEDFRPPFRIELFIQRVGPDASE